MSYYKTEQKEMLYTNLKHIESEDEHRQIIQQNEQVVVVCGRMDAASVSVYRVAEMLMAAYPGVKFCDMEFDNPQSQFLCDLFHEPEKQNLPLTIYYQDGCPVRFISGMQTTEQVAGNLEKMLKEARLTVETI
ncbi:MAG TPA: hypothetical protein PKH79_14480 [Prolixibacteraceae bacterium]|nr:hypothetical protein [Prolixibacteraceae bacterium]